MSDYSYDNETVKGFIVSSFVWGVVGILAGLLISIQMWLPEWNFPPYFTFGRLRTFHTNILAFGFGIGAIFGLFYYMAMRLTKRPLVLPKLARIHLHLFNATMVLGALTLLAGMQQSLEYAEFEWPVDVLIAVAWVIFSINIIGTVIKRRENQMYISLWYMLATVVGVTLVFVGNNLHIPAGLFKSYHLFAGVNSANVQWWYGHNAVGFVFTTPILPMVYYFLPKSTTMPIYSHRLSIISFWSLIFAYLWTGAHHLIYTPVPDWIQTLAIAFTIFLIAPSWGSVVNTYFTVGADWSKMRTHYLTKFFILGITFYGIQTVQGPAQGSRIFSSLIHYTDWVPGHVHMGTMGWVTMTIAASIYYLIPKIYRTEIFSVKAANIHFWLVLIAQLIFTITMWVTGIQQGAMWKSINPDGSLRYTFIESMARNYPYWEMRTVSGIIFTIGMVIFIYNIMMTIRKGKALAAARG